MGRGRRIAGEVGQHRAALLDPGVRVSLVDHLLRPGLVHAFVEDELRAVLGIVVGRDDGPAGEHLGEIQNIDLGVAGANAERMQLKDLAREILIEPAGAIDTGDRVGPDGHLVVKIDQHRRMAFGSKQEIGKAPENMRADCFALVAAGHVGHHECRDAEMVRPEPNQTLGKTDLSQECGVEPRFHLLQKIEPLGRRRLPGLRCRGGLGGLRHLGGVLAHAFTLSRHALRFLLGALGEDVLSVPGRARLEGGTRGLGAGHEVRIADAADARRSSSASSAPRDRRNRAPSPGAGPGRAVRANAASRVDRHHLSCALSCS